VQQLTEVHEQGRNMAIEETTTIDKQWLSPSEIRDYAGIGRTKLWELLSSGAIEGAKVGRAVKVNRSSVDEYMRRHSYSDSKS
jgi:excisionase family DNA binding protein